MAHKLLGSLGGFPGSQVLRQEYEKSDYLVEDRQHDNGSIRKQSEWDGVRVLPYVKNLWLWCLQRDIHLQAEHLPTRNPE